MINDPRLVPMSAMSAPVFFWAGMFSVMVTACVGLMAATYRR